MRKFSVYLLVFLLLMLGSASLASATDGSQSRTEVASAEWGLDWLGLTVAKLLSYGSDLVTGSFHTDNGQPSPEMPSGNATAESDDSQSDDDGGLLETGSQVEPVG